MSLCKMVLKKLKTVKFINSFQALREERGAIFVLTALLLPLLLGCLGFAYDAGNLYIHKARLQNTADAAALAGGRGYVDALSEHATNGIVTSISEEQREAAKGTLKSSAAQYIRNNNPIFVNKTGKEEKFWFGQKSTTVGEKTNSIEYFRVNLTEPVQLYFLPILGISHSMDVSVYATTKLTDTVVSGEGNNQQADAENRPVVIAGGTFYDEINPTDITHETYNDYNASTVYVQTGGTIKARNENGKYYVPSSGGDTTLSINGQPVKYAEVVETDYDMNAFGVTIKQRFIEKYIEKLPTEQQGAKRAKLTEFITDLKAWNHNKSTWDKKYKQEYEREYNRRNGLYSEALQLNKATSIYNLILKYRKLTKDAFDADNQKYSWNPNNTYDDFKDDWKQEIYSLTNINISDDYSRNLISNFYNYPAPTKLPTTDNWVDNNDENQGEWTNYTVFGFSKPPSKSVYLSDAIMNEHMSAYMAQFGSLGAEPQPSDYGLEYYMTYVMGSGGRNQGWAKNLSTNEISNDTSLSGEEHSYFYLPYEGMPDPNLEVNVDGFYVGGNITEDTPFYLFVDERINYSFNVKVTNCNRPLVICYLGTCPIHYAFTVNTKGVFYSPYAPTGTIINASDNVHFSGSIISDYVELKAHRNSYQYDPNEVKKWQDSSEGLPATPNIGFTGSSGGGNSGETTEKITLEDRLRLFLAGNTNQNNYYNPEDGVWNWTEL